MSDKPWYPRLTYEVEAAFSEAVRLGASRAHACQVAGIEFESYRLWITRGRETAKRIQEWREAIEANPESSSTEDYPFDERDRRPYEFYQAIRRAEGEGVIRALRQIDEEAENGAWQAAAWRLERRYPKEYGRQIHEHTGLNGGPIKIEWSKLTDEQLDAIINGSDESDGGTGTS